MVPSTPLSPGGRSTTTRRNPRKEQKSEHVLMHTVHFSRTLTSCSCVSSLHLYTHQLLLCLISSLVHSPAATVSHLFTCTLTSCCCVSSLHLYTHQLLLFLISSLVHSPAATVSQLFTCTLTSCYCVSTLHLYTHSCSCVYTLHLYSCMYMCCMYVCIDCGYLSIQIVRANHHTRRSNTCGTRKGQPAVTGTV